MKTIHRTVFLFVAIHMIAQVSTQAQIIRAGGSLHFSMERPEQISDDLSKGRLLGNRLYLDGTVDLEILHNILYAYTSFYTAGPGLEGGIFLYPVRKLPVYVNIGFGSADKENVPPFTAGLGAFVPIGPQSSLRFKFNGIGLTPSLAVGYAYSIYQDYDIQARSKPEDEFSGFDMPTVTARVKTTYVRKGRDCNVEMYLGNTTQQRQRDVLVDVLFYGVPIVPIEVRPVIVSHAVPVGKTVTSEDVAIFGLVGKAQELDVRSYGAFENVDPSVLSKIGLKPLRKNDVEITMTKFQVASDKVAEMKFEVRSNLPVDADGVYLRAELFDANQQALDLRYFSINERFQPGSTFVPEMSTIHDVDARTKFIKVTPVMYHAVED